MEKFISAKEYAIIKKEQDRIGQELLQNISPSEQFDLAFSMMSGDKDSVFEAIGRLFDKISENEEMKELEAQLKGAIVEQEITLESFEKTIDSLSSLDEAKANASNEELELYSGLMTMMQEKMSFGEANMNEVSSHFLLLKGLLEETNSSFESLKTYSKDTEILSMNLTSIEPETGVSHEFVVSLEEDKIYHKTTNPDNSFTQEEEYVSDKKRELEIEDFDGMSI